MAGKIRLESVKQMMNNKRCFVGTGRVLQVLRSDDEKKARTR